MTNNTKAKIQLFCDRKNGGNWEGGGGEFVPKEPTLLVGTEFIGNHKRTRERGRERGEPRRSTNKL